VSRAHRYHHIQGTASFERISWGQALAEIVERLTSVIGRYGGEAIWPYQGTGSFGYIQGIWGWAGRWPRLATAAPRSRRESSAN
jgi:anaerobic selenocysteine-containing dehydrogenase